MATREEVINNVLKEHKEKAETRFGEEVSSLIDQISREQKDVKAHMKRIALLKKTLSTLEFEPFDENILKEG